MSLIDKAHCGCICGGGRISFVLSFPRAGYDVVVPSRIVWCNDGALSGVVEVDVVEASGTRAEVDMMKWRVPQRVNFAVARPPSCSHRTQLCTAPALVASSSALKSMLYSGLPCRTMLLLQ